MTNSAYFEIHYSTMMVQVDNDQELGQWERNSHSKNRVGKKRS